MENYKFQHELNPELRGQAALANQRSAFITEFQYAKTRLTRQLWRWILCIGLVLLSATSSLWLSPGMSRFLSLVCVAGILYLLRGNNVVRLISILREMIIAKRRLRDWEVITKDVARTKERNDLINDNRD